jgi:hypothetical protein
MYQEIDIKLHIIFSSPQLRTCNHQLDLEIKQSLLREFPLYQDPMTVTEVESSILDAYVRITTSVDATLCDGLISNHIINKVRRALRMGVSRFQLISLREEAEIYGN